MKYKFLNRTDIAPRLQLALAGSGDLRETAAARRENLPGSKMFFSDAPDDKCKMTIFPEYRLDLGFLKRLVTPADEKCLVEGLREIVGGNESNAMKKMSGKAIKADAKFLLGCLLFKHGCLVEAEKNLKAALVDKKSIGKTLKKFKIVARMEIPITKEIYAEIEVDEKGATLALVEVYQRVGNAFGAAEMLERLTALLPDDAVVKLSLAELLVSEYPEKKSRMERVIAVSQELRNISDVHTALLLYRGKAFRALGKFYEARDTFSNILRRKKCSPELYNAIRYARALNYMDMDNQKKAMEEFEKVYAENPGYEDVAERLGKDKSGLTQVIG